MQADHDVHGAPRASRSSAPQPSEPGGYVPDPTDPLDQPERRLVIDDHESRVSGASAQEHAMTAGVDETDREDLPDAEPG